MKTLKNIWDDFVHIDNIKLAHQRAKKGKSKYHAIREVDRHEELFLLHLQDIVKSGKFTTSDYVVGEIFCGGKERILHKLPYYPDRIVHHMLMNLVSEHWKRSLIRDTYQSISGRGTSDCIRRVRKGVQGDKPLYCMKLDINKFYPSLGNDVTTNTSMYKLGDNKVLDILLDIITSLPFLPLGNHPSQFVGNLSLSDIDWFAKQQLKIRHYYRYCDDIVIMGNCKQKIYSDKAYIEEMLNNKGLRLKGGESVIRLDVQPLDFVGARFFHDRTLLRKSLEENFKENMKARNLPSVPSYFGWCKQVGAYNLYNKHAIIQ